ncbi:leucine-rich repeat-containing G protein-coupled receptor 1 isoform X2 [Brevipalpus obovatus]|uniref:leucine-rich repeat-containing G protein-coupled receptor 1 isoform X2 n=1 Tax=Brevipalpus obovatus TaxID=246614 RepID=UPI003D9DB6C4
MKSLFDIVIYSILLTFNLFVHVFTLTSSDHDFPSDLLSAPDGSFFGSVVDNGTSIDGDSMGSFNDEDDTDPRENTFLPPPPPPPPPPLDETNVTSSSTPPSSSSSSSSLPDEVYNQINRTLPSIQASTDKRLCECRKNKFRSRTGHFFRISCKCVGELITDIPNNLTQGVSELYLDSAKSLKRIEPGAFANLLRLRTISINLAPLLTIIPDGVFLGTLPNLRVLRIVRSGLEVLPSLNYLGSQSIISIIDFDSNQLKNVSRESVKVRAGSLNLDYNNIEFVDSMAFSGSEISKLSLKGNRKLMHIDEEAFVGLRSLRKLDLSETSIKKLPTRGLEDLESIRIEDTTSLKVFPSVLNFKSLKKAQLTYSYHCCAFKFPATQDPVEYAHRKIGVGRMCNNNLSGRSGTGVSGDQHRESSMSKQNGNTNNQLIQDDDDPPSSIISKSFKQLAFGISYFLSTLTSTSSSQFTYKNRLHHANSKLPSERYRRFTSESDHHPHPHHQQHNHDKSDTNSTKQNISEFGTLVFQSNRSSERNVSSLDLLENNMFENNVPGFGRVDLIPSKTAKDEHEDENEGSFHPTPASTDKNLQVLCGEIIVESLRNVKCLPEPDAFNPCEDVMGNVMLRVADWIVAVAAVFGNIAVMIVLMSGRFSMTVSKFLMCNLAFADFCMGLYLLIIAIIDVHTIGVYFNHAIDWQHGLGCKVTGFITVFASELSIFTLTVITLERWYAITYAIHLNRRLKLGLAVQIMVGGWIYASVIASLPLFGVSSYSKTSICLPMENRNAIDIAYLIVLLTTNALAFLLISACYGKMYLAIISQTTRAITNDMTIAKRMALLVFTDFACWAPIAFFGLTAVAGYPLINVTNSKILLVFFYPLNSCANPFLYAILTKQYRRDFFILASRYGFCTERAMRYKGTSSNCQHQRIFSSKSGEINRRNAIHGPKKQLYQYKSRSSLQQNSQSDDNSNLSVIYSAIDLFPESSISYDSSHEIVRMEYFNNKDDTRRSRRHRKQNYCSSISQSSSEESSSSVSRRSHLIIRDGKKMRLLPSSEREEILRKILGDNSDRLANRNDGIRKYSPQRNNIHKSHKNCSSWVAQENSSGEKSSSTEEDKLGGRGGRANNNTNHTSKQQQSPQVVSENASYVMSGHSNSAGEDIEL